MPSSPAYDDALEVKKQLDCAISHLRHADGNEELEAGFEHLKSALATLKKGMQFEAVSSASNARVHRSGCECHVEVDVTAFCSCGRYFNDTVRAYLSGHEQLKI